MNETELQKLLDEAIKRQFDFDDKLMKTDRELLGLAIAEDFFFEGVKAAIALLSKQYHETTNLSLK